MLRVLFIKNGLFIPEIYAGTELSTHYLGRDLIERGHRVAVAARTNRIAFKKDHGAKCDDSCGYPIYRARCFDDAITMSITKFRPDAIVCQEPDYWIGLDRFKNFRGIAFILYLHSRGTGTTTVQAAIRKRAAYLSNSKSTAAFLKTTFGIDSLIVPPIFGINRFNGLQRQGNNVLFVSIQLRKGADIAIEIARRRPDVSFIFLESWTQNPAETARLKNLIACLPNVKLMPNQADLRNVFRATRLLLMPSRSYEGWGRTATEAQLCGIPVLGSSRGQLGSTIGPGGIALDPDAGISLWLQTFDSIWNNQLRYCAAACAARDHAARLIEQKGAAIEQLESCLAAAVKRERLAATNLSLRPKPPRTTPVFARSDIAVTWRLLRLSLAAREPSERWPHICNAIARRDIASSPNATKVIAARIARATGSNQSDSERLVAATRAARHESAMQVLRSHLAGGWHPNITLEGRHYLDDALRSGNGAVLWMAHFAFAGTIVKMAIHGAGYRLGHFSRPEHGFSKTRFGIAILNPVRTSFENRYLDRRIIYRREQPGVALAAIRELLAENGVVTLTAGAWEGTRMVEASFLGSMIRLAVGPVRVARESSAILLPVFGVKTDRCEFSVRIAEPIDVLRDDREEVAIRLATYDFLTALAPMVLAYPAQWRGWSDLLDLPPPSAAQ